MSKAILKPDHSADYFEELFAQEHGYVENVDQEASIRKGREKAMRSTHGDKRKSRSKGDRVQFNQRLQRRIRDKVAQLCKVHRLSQTDALEAAFTDWIKKTEGARG